MFQSPTSFIDKQVKRIVLTTKRNVHVHNNFIIITSLHIHSMSCVVHTFILFHIFCNRSIGTAWYSDHGLRLLHGSIDHGLIMVRLTQLTAIYLASEYEPSPRPVKREIGWSVKGQDRTLNYIVSLIATDTTMISRFPTTNFTEHTVCLSQARKLTVIL